MTIRKSFVCIAIPLDVRPRLPETSHEICQIKPDAPCATGASLQSGGGLKLLTQPDDGISPLVEAINKAQTRVEIAIFRCDRGELEEALANAAKRGVFVHALIAYVNRGGEKKLRKLETRLLGAGVTVARTSDDLARYHGKFMIIDRRELHLFAFNFTHLDIDHSRSFGLVTGNARMVQEAVSLFEADVRRQPYSAKSGAFVVSPVNARKELAALVESARKELLIYDPEISDPLMIRLLEERAKAGVAVHILGRLTRRSDLLPQHKLPHVRLHTRCIVRDGREAFIGSQSLREVELAARREVGLIFKDPAIIGRLMKTFREDWDLAESFRHTGAPEPVTAASLAKKVAKAIAKDLPPVAPVLEGIVRQVAGSRPDGSVDPDIVENNIKVAVKEAVTDAVLDAVEGIIADDDSWRTVSRTKLGGITHKSQPSSTGH